MATLQFPKWHQFELSTGAPAASYWLHFLTTGTSTAKDAYSDVDATTPIDNPYQLNSSGRPAANIFISGKYRVVLHSTNDLLTGTSIADVDPVEDTVRGSSFQVDAQTYGGNNTGTANALVFTYSPAITSYTNGMILRGRITADCSGAVTVNAGGGVKSLVSRDGAALVSGELQGPDIIEFAYDSTTDVFRLMTPDGAAFLNKANTFLKANTFSLLQTFSLGADMTPAAAPSTTAVGYLGAPGNKQNAAYTFVMADAGWGVYHDETTARVWTIPPESGGGAVAFPRGTIIVIDNTGNSGGAPGALTIAITTDTLRRGDGVAGTGSRTVPANAVASIRKSKSVAAGDATTEWVISGVFT